jgi:hypothetical protein
MRTGTPEPRDGVVLLVSYDRSLLRASSMSAGSDRFGSGTRVSPGRCRYPPACRCLWPSGAERVWRVRAVTAR